MMRWRTLCQREDLGGRLKRHRPINVNVSVGLGKELHELTCRYRTCFLAVSTLGMRVSGDQNAWFQR